MGIGDRLREERERVGLSQASFGVAVGVGRNTQINYETDKRSPDGEYLAKAAEQGIDVRYVVTGDRNYEPPPTLSAEEQTMLSYFRDASPELRRAAVGALLAGARPRTTHDPGAARQIFHGKVGTAYSADVVKVTHQRRSKEKPKT